MKRFYITTAIDYVNAKPHGGHAFEKVIADAIARWHQLKGDEVFLLTGVDENAQKNVQAAEKAGIPTKEFIDHNTKLFMQLCDKLNIAYTYFVRTTAKEHGRVVQRLLKKMISAGDVYKGEYAGLYCTGCETYYTEKDLVNGKCPEHDRVPELRKEEAYFFRLSKYKENLLKFIPEYVVPRERANEMLARVRDEVEDICITRKNAKWGVDFPGDKNYKVWVWVDALMNYISGLGSNEKKWWPAQVHVIGKGINWFHSVIWPALLWSAKYKLPERLLVHGYLNLGGQKMSKSLGNIINPLGLLQKYPTDSVRYSLLRCPVFADAEYSEEILRERHNNELANALGNLVSRVVTLVEKNGGTLKKSMVDKKLTAKLDVKKIDGLMEKFEVHHALEEIWRFIGEVNKHINDERPWEMQGKEAAKHLYTLLETIRIIAILVSPFIPATAEKINKQLGIKAGKWKDCKFGVVKEYRVKKGDILFKKIQ